MESPEMKSGISQKEEKCYPALKKQDFSPNDSILQKVQRQSGCVLQRHENKIKVEERQQKSYKFNAEMKQIGVNVDKTSLDKTQFVETISQALGIFFSPFINSLAKRERQLCIKLGLEVQSEEKINKNKTRQDFQQEAKIQSQNQSNNKNHLKRKEIQQAQKSKENFETEKKNYNEVSNQNKSRIIRKIVRRPLLKRKNEQKILVKKMQQNFDCKLKNNRLYVKGMPKKPVSSFFFFFKQESKKIQQENEHLQTSKQLTYGSALAKRISRRWKQMTNQEKLPYQLLSKTTRQAYQKSMEDFKSQHKQVFDNFKKIKRIKANETRRIKILREANGKQYEEIQEIQIQENEENNVKDTQNKKMLPTNAQSENQIQIMVAQDDEDKIKKKRRTPQRNQKQKFISIHKPKSPSPSFFFYYNEKKVEISKEHNVTRGAKITQIASQMWKKMSQEEKMPYENMANERRKQYYEEMKKFEVNHPDQWAKMIAHRRRVTGQEFLKKNSQNKSLNSEKNSQDEEENSESIERQSQSLDSLQGIPLRKVNVKSCSKQDNEEKPQNIHKKQQTDKLKKEEQSIKQQKQENTIQKIQQYKKVTFKEQKASEIQSNKKQTDKNENHRPKAPISSFFMFYRQNNSALSQQFQQKNGGKLVQFASQIWKNMTQSEKKPYQIQAQQSRENYYKQMQIYKKKYPEEIKKRKLELKKKHENLGNNKSSLQKSRKKVKIQESVEEIK